MAGVATVSIVQLGAMDLSRRGGHGTVVYGKCSLSEESTWLHWSSNIVLTSGRLVNCINNIVLFPICMDTQLDTYNILLPLVLLLHTTCTYNPRHGPVHIQWEGAVAFWHTFVGWLPTTCHPFFKLRLCCCRRVKTFSISELFFLLSGFCMFVCIMFLGQIMKGNECYTMYCEYYNIHTTW